MKDATTKCLALARPLVVGLVLLAVLAGFLAPAAAEAKAQAGNAGASHRVAQTTPPEDDAADDATASPNPDASTAPAAPEAPSEAAETQDAGSGAQTQDATTGGADGATATEPTTEQQSDASGQGADGAADGPPATDAADAAAEQPVIDTIGQPADGDGDGAAGTGSAATFAGAPPVANNDAYTTPQDTTLTIADPGVLANDSDPDGDPISITGMGGASHGALFAGAGGFTYTPHAGFSGTDSFTYGITDGGSTTSIAAVTVTVTAATPTNTPPVAQNDSFGTPQDTPMGFKVGHLLSNDTDADGDPLAIAQTSDPSHGTLVVGDGKFTYTPDAGFVGMDAFTYTATDGAAVSNTATATIGVYEAANANTPPVANDDSYTVVRDTVLTVDAAGGVLANDTDADGDALVLAGTGTPINGTLDNAAADGSFTFTPPAGFAGYTSFT